MSWTEKMKEYGGGDFSFLTEDGEAITFVVVGEPILLEGKFKGNIAEKVGCPVVTEDGFVLFIAGKRLARKISKHESDFDTTAFIAIRHGGQNDITASYELRIEPDKELTAKLLAMRDKEVNQTIIDEAVLQALQVMRQ